MCISCFIRFLKNLFPLIYVGNEFASHSNNLKENGNKAIYQMSENRNELLADKENEYSSRMEKYLNDFKNDLLELYRKKKDSDDQFLNLSHNPLFQRAKIYTDFEDWLQRNKLKDGNVASQLTEGPEGLPWKKELLDSLFEKKYERSKDAPPSSKIVQSNFGFEGLPWKKAIDAYRKEFSEPSEINSIREKKQGFSSKFITGPEGLPWKKELFASLITEDAKEKRSDNKDGSELSTFDINKATEQQLLDVLLKLIEEKFAKNRA